MLYKQERGLGMESTLKFDRVVLIKELNEKFCKIGEAFEVANILENSFLLRDAKTKLAIGVVSFEDFENCFVHESNFGGWTNWQQFNGFDGQNDCFYKTNRKDVEVKFLTDKVRAKSFLHKDDEFNLSFGLNMAYLRCMNKALEKKKASCEEELKRIDNEIADNKRVIQKMIASLGASK